MNERRGYLTSHNFSCPILRPPILQMLLFADRRYATR